MIFQVDIHIFPIATYSVPTILAMQCRIFNVILDLNSCVHLRQLIYTKVLRGHTLCTMAIWLYRWSSLYFTNSS